MREIKFRAWDKEKLVIQEGHFYLTYDGIPLYTNGVPNNDLILMQFTGLKDKFGKDIYEGDIVEIPNKVYRLFQPVGWNGTENGIYEIRWIDKTSSFHAIESGFYNGLYMLVVFKDCWVIGNIYQNPDLLKEDL